MKRERLKIATWLTGAAVALLLAPMASQAVVVTDVDTELSLLIDVSGSVSGGEFNLQRQGYVDAFNNASVVAAIAQGALGKIAVNVVYWSSAGAQSVGVNWMIIDDAASSTAFATALANAGRPFGGATAPGSAIAYADPLFDNNNINGTRQVIDVSGDGSANSGISTSGARDAFLAGGGEAINGIVIGGSNSVLNFYQNNVQGGAGSFTLTAATFGEFGNVIDQKLIREITNSVPEPNSIALLAMGLLGAGFSARRARNKQS